MNDQQRKAEDFLALHHSGKLLILPNIWDVLGAKLLEKTGYKAIATASAAIAFANGYNDGENIPFNKFLDILTSISSSTHLPVSADIEKGYAENNNALADNIKLLLKSGIVGINIEDSEEEEGKLKSIELQCERIKLIRKTADQMGIPLVINARSDVYLSSDFTGNKMAEAIRRGQHYQDAGADCFYPILCDPKDLEEINAKVDLPVNVLATSDMIPMKGLELMGIARLSLGPSLLKSALTKMKEVVTSLKNHEGYESFTHSGMLSSAEVIEIIS